MNIGIPRERRPSEFRVGMTPVGVQELTQNGHTCFVEQGAGLGAGFSDEDFRQAGAQLVYSGEEAFGRADLVLKLARPTIEELDWLVPGQALMGFLYLPVADTRKIQALLDRRITAISYEQIRRSDGTLPVLKPLSQIGGAMAAQLAAHLLQNNAGGKGVLLGGVPGVPPAEVVIIGAGVVGEHAARAFLGMGAQVTLLDKDLERLQALSISLPGRVVTMVSHPFNVERACRYADVVVGAVHLPGERAPIVIPGRVVKKMRRGAVLLDLSIDEGGCTEFSRPTTHEIPTFIAEGVIHSCIPNLPGVVARTATHAFLNPAWAYILDIINLGTASAIEENQALGHGVCTHQGKIRNLKHPAFPIGGLDELD